MKIAETLGAMAEIYRLSRDGRVRSPRFLAYLARAGHEWGFAAYNPMAGAAALETVERLQDLGAEELARESGDRTARRCAFATEITLALVVASPGMWTDRVATEAEHRTTGMRRPLRGLVQIWAGEPISAEDVQREASAETVRTIWTELHGQTTTLSAVLAREGLSYALGSNPFGPPRAEDEETLKGALQVLGDTTASDEITTVLYGDEAATRMGWTPLGLADHAGFRWAAEVAARVVAECGPERALRQSWTLGDLMA
ncbi:MAG: hypothetical protein M3068_01030 [Gemmatimonadota bacterium]|nr:hypothetical protein [Gemmatimonadota bacterium]